MVSPAPTYVWTEHPRVATALRGVFGVVFGVAVAADRLDPSLSWAPGLCVLAAPFVLGLAAWFARGGLARRVWPSVEGKTLVLSGARYPAVAMYPRGVDTVFVGADGVRRIVGGRLDGPWGSARRPLASRTYGVLWRLVLTIALSLVFFLAIALPLHGNERDTMVELYVAIVAAYHVAAPSRWAEVGRDGLRVRTGHRVFYAPWGAVTVDRARRQVTLSGRTLSLRGVNFDGDEVDALLEEAERRAVAAAAWPSTNDRYVPGEPVPEFLARVASTDPRYRVAAPNGDVDRALIHAVATPADVRIAAAARLRSAGEEISTEELLDADLDAALRGDDTAAARVLRRAP